MAESSAPDYIELQRQRDFKNRSFETWLPRLGMALVAALPIVALFDVFGQAPEVRTVANPKGVATMTVSAPTKMRGGLLYQARFDIRANREIKDAVLVLESGWAESMTMNTIEPSPSSESSSDGSLAFDIGHIRAGHLWREYFQFQANPVNLGSQSQDATLYDGNVPLLHLNRTMMVWP